MNNENEVMEKAPVLTKKDCVKGAIRWSLMAVTTFNYDTGCCFRYWTSAA